MTQYDLILAGAGHAHLGVLRRWALVERPPGRIALLSLGPEAWYAGMLPGLISGRFSAADCRVELQPLCRAAKVDLIEGEIASLDADARVLQLEDGRCLHSEWMSLNVGASMAIPPQQGDAIQVLAARPIDKLLEGWRQWQAEPRRMAILGGGAGGVELALALADQVPALALFCGGTLLDGLSPGLRLRALGHLRQRGVQVREHCPIGRIEDDWLLSGDEPVWRGRRLLLASGARPWPWLTASQLATDAAGFIAIRPTLQSESHAQIFAVGDSASLDGMRRSGRFAVRQAPVLSANLQAALQGRPLRQYRAQWQSLALLATGDGGALLGWHDWSAGGQLYGHCKDWLDRRFVKRHRMVG
ncbi:FAD-dependent pyridine nucleotide-disulfide oxidoreductase [Ectopseudomonas mendocina]|uniref:FAD-dependent oxidoreductase n=1 Tax=Ectopseudomonas mendocina TaxID=300 RepID=UPI000E076D2D|nr:FAD-dependent oxidoreductase [Pseudomonas mendocina]QTN47648.1 FAD-dependent oxidoreductase [Pseudomonas mendocina]SUD35893.1 FAD-dependent pyridine nucleotide-disulfide oxidoreductase [Pseudomonas mendocina]